VCSSPEEYEDILYLNLCDAAFSLSTSELIAHFPSNDTHPLNVLYDFSGITQLSYHHLQRLAPLFGLLSNHPLTRSAFLAASPDQIADLYQVCKIRGAGQLGQAEVFLHRAAALRWLRGE